jgi:hypothetical protein
MDEFELGYSTSTISLKRVWSKRRKMETILTCSDTVLFFQSTT